jgi:hypothetical protein
MSDQVQNVSELLAPDKANRLSPTWFAENVMNPAINAGPLGVYNTAADLVNLPTVHLKTEEAKPYSPEWFAQGLSSGVGAAVPFVIMSAATGSLMGAADRKLAGTALGTALNPYLTSEKVATIAGASIYGALQKPDADHTRLGNAIGMGAGLAVFSFGNGLIKDAPMMQKALAYPVIGFVGGGTMTEVSQLASNLKLAKNDAVLQGAVQGMTMNTVMGLGGDYLSKRLQADQQASAEHIAEAQRNAPKAVLERAFNPDEVKVQQYTPQSRAAFAKIADLDKEYSDFVKDNKPNYPHPDNFDALSPDEIVKLGFHHDDASNLEILNAFKGDKKPRPLPDAKVVASEVGKVLKDMPLAKDTGDLQIGEWNMEFLTKDKAQYFKDTYSQIVPRHHLLFVEEANEAGLKQIAQDNGYKYAVSAENSRGQAVGFLYHPRLELLKETSIDAVADVHNIPDLRPALKLDLRDAHTGEDFSAVVVHLKSMRGGPEETAPIRTQQAQILANELGPNFKGIIAGDWNTFLDKTQELNPLKAAGFQINNPNDHSTTQSMGGRLDGFVTKGLTGSLTQETINPFFKNPLITRGLSDHALLSTTLKVGK